MDDFYADMQNVAREILGEFAQGSPLYVSETPGTGPADDPGAPTVVEIPFDGAARGVSFKYVDNAHIVATDLQITMPAGGVTPTMEGAIKIDGVRYKIVEIKTIPPIGTPVVHVVIFRK